MNIDSKKLEKQCDKHNVMPCGSWQEFTGQKLNTKDLVLFKDSGLAFVDSSLTTEEPDRFTSMPENWTFGTFQINRRTAGKMGYAHVRKNGWVYRDEEWRSDRVDSLKWDKITHFMRVGSHQANGRVQQALNLKLTSKQQIMSKDYFDNVLIKLKRKYSENEVISALTKKLSEKDFKIGELTSERDELKHNLRLITKKYNHAQNIKGSKEIAKEVKKEQMYKSLKEQISAYKQQIKSLREMRDKLLNEKLSNEQLD